MLNFLILGSLYIKTTGKFRVCKILSYEVQSSLIRKLSEPTKLNSGQELRDVGHAEDEENDLTGVI